MRDEYTQASLLVFRPSLDLLDELKKNRGLYIPEPHDPWFNLYSISDTIRLNIHRVKSRVEESSTKRIGDHPVMNASISLGAKALSQEKDIDPLLDIRRHFNSVDANIDRLTANVIQSIFETFPITFSQGKKQTLHVPLSIYTTVKNLSEDVGTSVSNICTLSMMRSLSLLPETIFEASQEMVSQVDEFRKLCRLRYRAMKAILEEFEL